MSSDVDQTKRRTFRVNPRMKWVDTGIVTTSHGEPIIIEYQGGEWSANPNEGATGPLGHESLIAKEGYSLPGKPEGALVGKIDSTVFMIGLGTTVPVDLNGRLFLGINDDLNARYGVGFDDNEGSIEVEVSGGSTNWIEIRLEGEDQRGIPGHLCQVIDSAGVSHEKSTDANGVVRFEGINDHGNCEVTFPGLDGNAWELKGEL